MHRKKRFRAAAPVFGIVSIVSPVVFIVLAGMIPIAFILLQSFSYSDANGNSFGTLSLDGYRELLHPNRLKPLIRIIERALAVVCTDVILGVPVSFALVRLITPKVRFILLGIFTVPFLVSDVTRAFAWRIVLGQHGIINGVLAYCGISGAPAARLLFNDAAVSIALVAGTLSFVVFTTTLSLSYIPSELWYVADEFGLNMMKQLVKIAFPLSLAAIVAGAICSFLASLGTSVEMSMLGGIDQSAISRMVSDLETARRLNAAFALATLICMLICGAIFGYRLLQGRGKSFVKQKVL